MGSLVFRTNAIDVFGIVTGHFGDLTDRPSGRRNDFDGKHRARNTNRTPEPRIDDEGGSLGVVDLNDVEHRFDIEVAGGLLSLGVGG